MSRAEKKQSPPPSPITSLPEDVVVDILARLPISDYPRVSLVSKRFRSLVSSPEIYARRRSSLGCTEHCLYVFLYNCATRVNRLYTLRRGNSSSRLVLIPGLPPYGSFAAVGSRIYERGAEFQVLGELRAYDPERKCWQVVKGLDDLLAEIRRAACCWLQTVSYGGKLVLLYGKGEFSWLTKEVSLEIRKGGQIWGKVYQWCDDHALIAGNFIIRKSLDVVL
ncbi:hypothetical protein HID58_062214 [Brassica napus]|uniref:F-box domain-containing protein n=1 Tax=Brassica napus TaxID=3708 RepID=A0ABQ8A1J6_BRANA|nr:F-box/kelch-repeat protein At4g38940-like [Brassica napus]XP_048611941.1 F-box/kelch-repeat protein At4g38940-like [Brassica napus]KAH0886118.1 hypothetical protein HID58_062214 [Brassica napus]